MNEKGIKRKKKSFLQKTVKFYKKGVRGKGVHINEETFEYFLHVLKILNQDFESEEDKKAFVENVFEQLHENEVNYSCNQVVSRIVEKLLPLSSNQTVTKFMNAFSEDFRPVSTDPFASFVLQKLIVVVTDRYLCHNSDDVSSYREWLLKIFKYVLNNLEEFIYDNYANRVMRTVIICLIGQTTADCNNVSKNNFSPNVNIDDEFISILKNFVSQLLEWPQFSELPYQNLSSAFLQVLVQCIALVDVKRTKRICKKLLNECFASRDSEYNENNDEKKLDGFSFTCESCVRLLEVTLSVAPAKLFTKIYAKCFINRLPSLAQKKESNFAVQKLLRHCQNKTEFEAMFDELSTSFEVILEQGNSGIILQLCEACVHLKTKQSVFMQLWMNYLGCNEPKEAQLLIFPLTVFMKKRNDYNHDEENVDLRGSLLIQNMLKFNKPIKIISSILDMNRDHLVRILCNPKGSYICDVFFESEYVGEKSYEKFIKTLLSSYSSLCVSKHGSRVFDTVWKYSNIKNRISIAGELLENESKLQNNAYGRPIAYNISLAAFRHSRDDWIKGQSKGDKAKQLFANIL